MAKAPPPFKYKRRPAEAWEKRATQKGGDFQGIIIDDVKTYQIKKGDNFVRVFPPTWNDADHFGLNVYVHYQVGPDKAQCVCLARAGKGACPLCEARIVAERDGDEDLKDALRPRKRVVVWMLDQKERDKGPMIWVMPWTLDRDITSACKDKETGAIFYCDDPDEGYNISFTKQGEGQRSEYLSVQLSRKPSSISDDDLAVAQELPVPETIAYLSYDEILELYEGPGGGDRDRGRDDPAPSRRRAAPPDDDAPPPRGEADYGRSRTRASAREEPEDDPPPRTSRGRSAPPEDEPEPTRTTTRRRAAPPPDEPEDDPPPRTSGGARRSAAPEPEPEDEPEPARGAARSASLRERYEARRGAR